MIRSVLSRIVAEAKMILKARETVKAAGEPKRVSAAKDIYGGGKHYGGSHAQACPSCRVTLSHGSCLNRMCGRMDRGRLAAPVTRKNSPELRRVAARNLRRTRALAQVVA
jgi:hypothetical protein